MEIKIHSKESTRMNIEGTIVLKQLRSNKRIEYLENKYFSDKIQTELVGYETD
ncbi:hypothetical protein [Floccifex sp.]|uniref:hypothetical protein n=1 Tax=Floccifex sp. TaxID=2815810 RepID=UPI003F0E39E3